MTFARGFAQSHKTASRWIAGLLLVLPYLGALPGAILVCLNAEWYSWLVKPSFAPPDWLHAPIWMLIYILTGLSSYVLCRDAEDNQAVGPLLIYVLALGLNWAWLIIFFGVRMLDLTVLIAILAWAAATICVITFLPVSKLASLLILPYACWLFFTALLCAMIWHLNDGS